MSPRLRSSLRRARLTALVTLSALVMLLLLVVSWLIYMPIMALLAAPFSIFASTLHGRAPSPELNTVLAVSFAGLLAVATVAATLRVLMRRARKRRAHHASA